MEHWPLLAKAAALLRSKEDRGVGDTVERCLANLGVKSVAEFYKKVTGSNCDCSKRKETLNWMYPYPPGE
jgi:hypothetical protein